MERLSKADCRQEKTGSCDGCPVYKGARDPMNKNYSIERQSAWEDAWKQVHVDRTASPLSKVLAHELSKRVSEKYCPEGNRMEVTWRALNF